MSDKLIYEFISSNKDVILPVIKDYVYECISAMPEGAYKKACLDDIDYIAELVWDCLTKLSTEPITDRGNAYIKNKIHDWLNDNVKIGDRNFKQQLVHQLTEVVYSVWLMLQTGNGADKVKDLSVIAGKMIAKKTVNDALDIIDKKLPDSEFKNDLLEELYVLSDSGIDNISDAEAVALIAKKSGVRLAAKTADKQINAAIDKAMAKLPNSEGKRETEALLRDIVGDTCNRLQNAESFEEAGEIALDIAKTKTEAKAKEYLEKKTRQYADEYAKKGSKALKSYLKTSGKGSRKRNRYINGAVDSLTNNAANNIVSNVMDVVSGDKDITTAARDVIIDTGKASATEYLEKHGEQIVREALKEIEKQAMKRISDEAAKKAISGGLQKLSNSNTVMQVAGAAVDIGVSFKKYFNGDIDESQLLNEVINKGVNTCASTLGSSIGFALGGPLGAAAGSMIASMACDCLYTALSQIMFESKSKQRYEEIHAMCEESKRLLRAQRIAFEKATEQLFARRRATISNSFMVMDKALKDNNVDGFNMALVDIAGEFGREAEIMTFGEFQDFMLNSDDDFVL